MARADGDALGARQLLRVYLCVLAAVAVLFQRDAFPAWARPELWALDRVVVAQQQAEARDPDAWNRTVLDASLTGQPTLVVGDSLVHGWIWPADRVQLPGHSARRIAQCLNDILGDRQYDRIILWPGTCELAWGGGVEAYVAGVVRAVRIARRHTDRVVVIGPMPYSEEQLAIWLRQDINKRFRYRLKPTTVHHVAQAVAALRDRLPGTVIVDAGRVREAALRRGLIEQWYEDGVHLRYAGFEALGAELARAGIAL